MPAAADPPLQPGVLANTMTAKPWTVGQKFHYRLYPGFLLRGITGAALGAGIAQASNRPGAWGGGAEGYFHRFGSGLAVAAIRQGLAFGMESSMHIDPRYFPTTDTRVKPRVMNALKQVFVSKTDRGTATLAYARLISAFGAGQIQRTWLPSSNNAFGDGLITGAGIIAGDTAVNLISEFIPRLREKSLRHKP